jgi:hypothetical protein
MKLKALMIAGALATAAALPAVSLAGGPHVGVTVGIGLPVFIPPPAVYYPPIFVPPPVVMYRPWIPQHHHHQVYHGHGYGGHTVHSHRGNWGHDGAHRGGYGGGGRGGYGGGVQINGGHRGGR